MKQIHYYVSWVFFVLLIENFLLSTSTATVIQQNSTTATVTIDNLTIVGKIKRTAEAHRTYGCFKGIRYAKPPLDDLRFKPPVPLPLNSTTSGVLYALNDGPPCAQFQKDPLVYGSEDCLLLNIYVPFINDTSTPLAVLLFYYGGAFVGGSDRFKEYDPSYFLVEGIIVVTVNYRLSVFGFLSTEDDASPGNYGLKDQILALNWVKTNIRYFNGDPEKITINGQSAGAASVSYLSMSPLTRGLYRACIMESGTTLNLWALARNARNVAFLLAGLVNVNITNSYTVVEGLRKVDYRDLVVAAFKVYVGQLILANPLDGLPFGPTIEPPHPGAVVLKPSHEQLLKQQFNNVSFLMGFNSLEALKMTENLNMVPLFYLKFDLTPTSLVPASMNVNSESKKLAVNEQIRLHYFGYSALLIFSGTKKIATFISDDQFVRPIVEAGRLYSRKSPLFFYKFSYKPSTDPNTLGVSHADELSYLWQSMANPRSSADYLTIRRMVTLWSNFVKTGNPTPAVNSLFDNVTWPLATSHGRNSLAFVDIGEKIVAGVNPNHESINFWNKLFQKYGRPPYSTY